MHTEAINHDPGEFGRTIFCQGRLTEETYGRDHHPRSFTINPACQPPALERTRRVDAPASARRRLRFEPGLRSHPPISVHGGRARSPSLRLLDGTARVVL